ncbi:hypothetical protein HDU91_000196, partial [Kappamyces sp. JEL0680]
LGDPSVNINSLSKSAGISAFTLAFMVDNGAGTPAWQGTKGNEASSGFYKDQISTFQKNGGQVIISFGGAAGKESAAFHTDETTLMNKYLDIVKAYGVSRLDFDIEGDSGSDVRSNLLRIKALKKLRGAMQALSPPMNLTLSFTLPVLPSGLAQEGKKLLQDCKDNGLAVDIDVPENMGKSSISAAVGTLSQLEQMGLKSTTLGITPMIGENDTQGLFFQKGDSKALVSYAQSESRVSLLAFWSINRDFNRPNAGLFQSTHVDQRDFEFSSLFNAYTTAPK